MDGAPGANGTHPAPSGEQWIIASGQHRATLVEVGGGIRSYQVDGADVVDGFPVTQMCTGSSGQILAPWPNRIRDGRYTCLLYTSDAADE